MRSGSDDDRSLQANAERSAPLSSQIRSASRANSCGVGERASLMHSMISFANSGFTDRVTSQNLSGLLTSRTGSYNRSCSRNMTATRFFAIGGRIIFPDGALPPSQRCSSSSGPRFARYDASAGPAWRASALLGRMSIISGLSGRNATLAVRVQRFRTTDKSYWNKQ